MAKHLCVVLILISYALLQSLIMAKSNPEVILITEQYPPYSYKNEQNQFVGSSAKIVKKLFKSADISYEIKILPWKRALSQQSRKQDLMIFPFSRIPERENEYHWIAHLQTLNLRIFGLSGKYNSGQTDISSGQYKFVCIEKSSHCEILKKFGVPIKSIVTITGLSMTQMIDMVVRERVNFLLTTKEVFQLNIEKQQLNSASFVMLENYKYPVSEYLAASKNVDMVLIEKLKQAAQNYDP